MSIKDKAARIRALTNDETFKEVMQEIRDIQATVFLNSQSEIGVISDAHDIIRALDQIENYFTSVFTEEAIFDKIEKRGTAPWKRLKAKM